MIEAFARVSRQQPHRKIFQSLIEKYAHWGPRERIGASWSGRCWMMWRKANPGSLSAPNLGVGGFPLRPWAKRSNFRANPGCGILDLIPWFAGWASSRARTTKEFTSGDVLCRHFKPFFGRRNKMERACPWLISKPCENGTFTRRIGFRPFRPREVMMARYLGLRSLLAPAQAIAWRAFSPAVLRSWWNFHWQTGVKTGVIFWPEPRGVDGFRPAASSRAPFRSQMRRHGRKTPQRVLWRKPFFQDDRDRALFSDTLAETRRKTGWQGDAQKLKPARRLRQQMTVAWQWISPPANRRPKPKSIPPTGGPIGAIQPGDF